MKSIFKRYATRVFEAVFALAKVLVTYLCHASRVQDEERYQINIAQTENIEFLFAFANVR
jgi:hypothetical protein